ncbi:uncharacterized protein LOC141908932 [Tubulanus polymorphus]|uniref:uncharacterized protein LOC141908932 n=1 Tax=Tubulanus polymorphus TaxID=672921 RepID=UPI003DA37379
MAEESQEVIFEGSFQKLPALDKKKSSLRLGKGSHKEKYWFLLRQADRLYLEYHDKKPNSPQTDAKGRISLWPMYRVTKNRIDSKFVCEIRTQNQKVFIASTNQRLIDEFVYYLQTQTALKQDLEGQSFLVSPVNSVSHQSIGSVNTVCYLHISPWGVSLAIQSSRAMIAQWPLKSIRTYQTSGKGSFTVIAGRRAPFGEGIYEFRTRRDQDNEIFGLLDHFIHQEHSVAELVDVGAVMNEEYDRLRNLTVLNPRSSRLIEQSRNSGFYDHLFQQETEFKMRNVPDLVATAAPDVDHALLQSVKEKLEQERKSLLNTSDEPPPPLPRRRASGPLPPRQTKSVNDSPAGGGGGATRLYEDLNCTDEVFTSTPRVPRVYQRSKSNVDTAHHRNPSNGYRYNADTRRSRSPRNNVDALDADECGYLPMEDVQKSRENLDLLNDTRKVSTTRSPPIVLSPNNCESLEDILNETRSEGVATPRNYRQPPPLPAAGEPESAYIDTSDYIETSIKPRTAAQTPTRTAARSNYTRATSSCEVGPELVPPKPARGRSSTQLRLSRKVSIEGSENTYMKIDEDKMVPMPFTGLISPESYGPRHSIGPRHSDGDDVTYTELNENTINSINDFRSLDIKKAKQKKMLKTQSNPDMGKNGRKSSPDSGTDPPTETKKRESRLAALFTLRKRNKNHRSNEKNNGKDSVKISGVIISNKPSKNNASYVKQKSPEQRVIRRRADTTIDNNRHTLNDNQLNSPAEGITKRAQSVGDLI